MKFKKITYDIDWSCGEFNGETKRVEGYAVNFYPVRICIRKVCRGVWTVDHYDSGLRINIAPIDSLSRESAAIAAMKHIYKGLSNGSFQKAAEKYESLSGRVILA